MAGREPATHYPHVFIAIRQMSLPSHPSGGALRTEVRVTIVWRTDRQIVSTGTPVQRALAPRMLVHLHAPRHLDCSHVSQAGGGLWLTLCTERARFIVSTRGVPGPDNLRCWKAVEGLPVVRQTNLPTPSGSEPVATQGPYAPDHSMDGVTCCQHRCRVRPLCAAGFQPAMLRELHENHRHTLFVSLAHAGLMDERSITAIVSLFEPTYVPSMRLRSVTKQFDTFY